MGGALYGTPSTRDATRIPDVPAASHASNVHSSNVGLVPDG